MTLREFFATKRESMPAWLSAYPSDAQEALPPSEVLRRFLRSRTVYYPGSGSDGGPVAAFNSAHAAHCFVYVDYLVERSELLDELQSDGFRGYRRLARVDLREADFGLGNWRPHVTGPVRYPFKPVRPYGFIEILERAEEYSEAHGAERFAVLFLAADGHAAFDAIFCQGSGTPVPFCVVLQDHGFGCNYSAFGEGGLLAQIASGCRVLPEFLLVADNTDPWRGVSGGAKVGQWSGATAALRPE